MNSIIETEIDNYIHKYAQKHNITEKEAKRHVIAKIVEHYFRKEKIYDENQ